MIDMGTPKPYTDDRPEGSRTWHRAFVNPDEDELVWHRDKADRDVLIDSGSGWKLQMDNELPFDLIEGQTYHIPKMTFHRLIKTINSSNELNITITET